MALKAEGPAIVHKTEIGAVRIGLADSDEVGAAATAIDEELAQAGIERGVLRRPGDGRGGVELLAGIVADPVFGPVIACGAGGIHAELLKDVRCDLPDHRGRRGRDASWLAVFPLLTGFRGAAAVDLARSRTSWSA